MSEHLDERGVWDYLMTLTDSENLTAALMGNMKRESGIRGNNLQQTGEKALGMTDDMYTEALNVGSYTKDQFVYDHFGYGLCQWTYWSRKQAFYAYWKSSSCKDISSEWLQCNYAIKELQAGYSGIWSNRFTDNIDTLTIKILKQYEAPADTGEKEQSIRCRYAHEIYEKYHIKSKVISKDIVIKMLNDLKACIDDCITEVNEL